MSNSLGEAVLDLAADAAGLITDINSARPRALTALQAIGVAGGALLAAGIMAAATAVVAITALMWSSANTLDAAYDNIQTRTGATGAELEGLKADFEQVFTSVPTDAETASNAIGILNSRLGLTGVVLQNTSRHLIEMTRLTGGDLATNAEAFTRLLGDWALPAELGAQTLDKVFVASQQTGVGIDRLMQLMVQFGAPMRLFGFSFEESAAMLSKWEQEGVNTELVMGSLRIAAAKFANENIDLATGLAKTAEAIKNAKTESQALAIGMEVFGARAGPDMVAAIREGRFEIGDLVNMLNNATGAISNTSDATMDWGERLQMFKNKVTTQFAPAGQKLMDVAVKIMDVIAQVFDRPDVQAAIQAIATWIGDMAEKGAAYLPVIVDAFFNFVSFLQNNQGVVIAILAAIGVAIIAFAVSVAPAIWAVTAPILAIIAIMALVAGVAYLVYQAWTNNWGGIQTKLTALWTQFQPIFMQLVNWLQTNIPLALQALSTYWTTTLLPALQTVWLWIQTYLFPLFSAIATLIGTALTLAVKTLAGLWINVLWPAFKKVIDWMETKLWPVLEPIAIFFRDVFAKALKDVQKIIEGVTAAIRKLIDALNSIDLPSDLTPGSPTPFEMGLRGIHKALTDINRLSLPKFASGLQFNPAMASMIGAGASSSIVSGDTYNINGISMPNVGPQTTLDEIKRYYNKRN